MSAGIKDILEPVLIDSLKNKVVLVKYGGNAMLNDQLKLDVLSDICTLLDMGMKPVIVHGGGPFINDLLKKVGVESEFIDGHRKTTPEALKYIEMALKGQVNSDLVRIINSLGKNAVGLSGKDGNMVIAEKRYHVRKIDGKEEMVDLQQVGDVAEVSTALLRLLLGSGYIPVIATIASGKDNMDYNINADMFAGHLAGALEAEAYIAMTDVDGLLSNPEDKTSLIRELSEKEIASFNEKAIKGGMIPKMDSCLIALKKGVRTVRIINGTKKHSILLELFTKERSGTLLKL